MLGGRRLAAKPLLKADAWSSSYEDMSWWRRWGSNPRPEKQPRRLPRVEPSIPNC